MRTHGAGPGAAPAWKVWLRRVAAMTRLFLVIALVSAGVFVLQTVRAVQAMRQEQALTRSIAQFESLSSRLPPELPGETTAAELRALPHDMEIAEVLLDLRRMLQAAGIEDYRCALVPSMDPGALVADGGEHGFSSSRRDRQLIPDEPAYAERAISILDWMEPLDIPEELEEWRFALELQAGFAQLLGFLLRLDETPGIWSSPRIRVRPNDGRVEAEIILRAFAERLGVLSVFEDHPAPGDDRTAADPPHPDRMADKPLRDPFRPVATAARRVTEGEYEAPIPPSLGAIRWTPDPSVWMEGRVVRPGDRVGDWVLVEVLQDAAVMRHRSGLVARVKAGL